MSTESEIRKNFSIFMNELRMREAFKDGKPISQTEMSRRIGIPQGSLSQYEKGTRIPDTENAHLIAAFAGVKVYDILEMPRSLPNDKELVALATVWPDLTKDMKKKLVRLAQDEYDLLQERIKTVAGQIKTT